MNRDICMQVEGFLLERLLQKAIGAGAVFARVNRTGPRSMELHTDRRSAQILTRLCKKYGLNCRIMRCSGRTACIDYIRSRWTLLPALILCAVICALFLGRIWMVEIAFTGSCAHMGNEANILSVLQNAGVRAGMSAREIDSDLLQKQISAEAGDYSYIGVRRQGIRLLVEAAPEVPAPGVYAIEQSRNLYAARNGVVESIEVYSGEACVQPGDTVLKGQMLIRGEEKRSEEETTPVRALGTVTARCWYEGSAEAPTLRIIEQPTGKTRTSCSLNLMQLSLPVLKCEPFPNEETETEIIPVVGLFLPLQIERTAHRETVTSGLQADEDELRRQLELLARADALKKISAENTDYEVASHWTDAIRSEHSLRIRAVYEIYTDIAADRDALTEEVY